MKIQLVFVLLALSCVSFSQKANSYLIKGSGQSKEKVAGSLYGDKISSQYLNDVFNITAVYIDDIDPSAAKIDIKSKDEFVFHNYLGKKISFGIMEKNGNFPLPPLYTHHQEYSPVNSPGKYILLGQKLANGNWRAAAINRYPDKWIFKAGLLPEMKDYNLMGPDLIVFRDLKDKIGIMDLNGNIRVNAIYDSLKGVINYLVYDDVKKTGSKALKEVSPIEETMEECYKLSGSKFDNSSSVRIQRNTWFPLYIMKNNDSVILVSTMYKTRPVKNPVISSHSFGSTMFYLIRGSGGIFDIIDRDGTKPEDKFKYAYLETIRRDTTPGMEKKWEFDVQKDYTKPFKTVNYDSIKLAEEAKAAYMKKVEEEKKAKIAREAAERRRELVNDPTNYATDVEGTYEVSEFKINGFKYQKYTRGSYSDNSMSVTMPEKNRLVVNVKFAGLASSTDAQYQKYEVTLNLKTDESLIMPNGPGSDGSALMGVTLLKEGAIIMNNGLFDLYEGYYNRQTKEFHVTFKASSGEQVSIRATKK
ncbi:MAG: hypothetical protein U0X39_15190 [Bacteroidales bacterium]